MRVLVVEDEPRLAAGLRNGLVAEGFAVDVALDGTNGLWLARERPYDVFVLDAWSKASGAEGIEFISDGNGDFARAVGLNMDGSGFGLGTRSQRYSMVVENGVVKALNVEDAPAKAQHSGANGFRRVLFEPRQGKRDARIRHEAAINPRRASRCADSTVRRARCTAAP